MGGDPSVDGLRKTRAISQEIQILRSTLTITIDPSAFAEQFNPSAHSMPSMSHPPERTDSTDPEPSVLQQMPLRWPRLMRRSQVAEYLSVSDRYIDNLIKHGYIPGPKLTPSARCALWDRDDIDRWLDDTHPQPDAQNGVRSFDDIIRSSEDC